MPDSQRPPLPLEQAAPEPSLHIVHIISGLGQGGAETVLHRLITAPTQIYRHTVISLTDQGAFGPRLQWAGIEVIALGMSSGRLSLSGLARLHRLLREIKPDVVQTWMYHADLVGGVVARLSGIRAVSWGIRNSGAHLQESSAKARVVGWVCARLSGVVPAVIVACAENAADRHRQWGYRADRMLVIPNGYDLSRWRPDPAARVRLRAQWGLAQDAVLIGAVARWNPLKDHANLLAATALCVAVNASLRCVLVGHGMDESNGSLQSLINRFGLRDKVILLGERDDIPDVMNALDVHVLSSCAEGFPNVVAEAMAVGVACVVTNVGDAARIVGGHGWVAPPQNADALAHVVNQAVSLLGTAEMAERIRLGRERVGNLFSLETMVSAYQGVWRRLAIHFPGRHRSHARRLLFVVNNPAFFLSHRLPLALAAMQAGMDVHVATMDGPSVPRIVAHGLSHHVIPLSRSGKNPVLELYSLYALWRLFRRLRPHLVHAVTIKPVLYGGIAARAARVPAFVAAISGLGFVFMRQRRHFDFLRWAATFLYRLALGHPNSRVIFQNIDDRNTLRDAGVVSSTQAVLIRGSGVDLTQFKAVPEPHGAPVAIMVARLLVDKGVREFVAAARLAAGHPSGLRWVLVGSPDKGNPASVADEELADWRREGVVECLGEQDDIASLYARSHIAVLPSYREGLPKSLIEAAACGRPIVTTDVPGCRDAIEPNITGLLVPARDAKALCKAVLQLAGDGALRRKLGAAGRLLAEREFDVRHVAQAHLDLYTSLMT